MGRAEIVASRKENHIERAARAALLAIAVLVACLLTRGALAQVTFMDFFKVQVHVQISNDTPPGGAILWAFDQAIETTTPGDYTGGALQSVFPYTLNGATWEVSALFPDQTSLDNAIFEFDTLLIDLGAGTQPAIFSVNINIGANNYPPSPPYLTGTSYNDLQLMNTANALTLTFPSPSTVGSTQGFLEIVEDPDGADIFVFDVQLTSGDTSVLIPAGTLQPGKVYRLEMGYTNGTLHSAFESVLNAPFFIAYDNITFVMFSTATSASSGPDLNNDNIVNGADLGLLLGAWGTSP
jgi:hypothetical protein